LQADIHADEARLASLLAARCFDAVVDWIDFNALSGWRGIKFNYSLG